MKFLGIIIAVLLLQIAPAAAENQNPSMPAGDTDKLYSMEFRQADIRDVIRFIGQETGLNIIIGDDITGQVSLSFKDVTLMGAFSSILKTQGLSYIREKNIIRVVNEKAAESDMETTTSMVRLNYSDALEASRVIQGVLGKQGSVSVDKRTNTLIIKDTPANMENIMAVLDKIDSETPQILIETRIVEVNKDFTHELGIQWGGGVNKQTSSWNSTVTGGNSRPDTGSASLPITGGVGLSGNNLLVNLPASVAENSGAAIGFSFGNVKNTLQLDIQLSALENSGKGKILSRPRILTLDNREARISSGTEILIPTATLTVGGTSGGSLSGNSATTGVTTVDAKLELSVLPHITTNQNIMLHVKVNKKDPDFNRMVANIPPLTTKTAETDLLVKDNTTMVIGGILTRNESTATSGVPLLSKLPLIGWLFKKQVQRNNEAELLIFLTPQIIKPMQTTASSQEAEYPADSIISSE